MYAIYQHQLVSFNIISFKGKFTYKCCESNAQCVCNFIMSRYHDDDANVIKQNE